MPRFYLNVRDGQRLIEDLEGSDLPDLEAAREKAFEGARQILADKVRAGHVVNGQQFEIVDEDGELQAVVPLRDALRLA